MVAELRQHLDPVPLGVFAPFNVVAQFSTESCGGLR